MAGLFDAAGLDGRTGLLGALAQQEQLGGLLTPFKPSPNESWLEKLVGSGDPRDPRNAASMALAAGMIRGDFASGLEGYQRAWSGVEDRNTRRAAESLQMRKNLLELSELERQRADEAGARQVAIDFHARGPQSLTPLPSYPKPMLQAPGMPPSSGSSATQQPDAHGGAQVSMPPLLQPQPGGVPALAALGTPTGASQMFERYNALANALESKGHVRQAQAAREFALKFRPKFATEPRVLKDPVTGQLVNVLVGEDGTTQVLPFGVKPSIHMQDRGGFIEAIDENNLRGGEAYAKTLTPGEAANNQVAQGNLRVAQGQLGLARERFNSEMNSPQYLPTDAGLFALPKKPQGGGPIIGRLVTDGGGNPLGSPLKPIPASANTAIVTNMQNLDRAKQALALVQGGQVNGAQGDKGATGVKGYLPNGLLNRMDPGGADTRAAIADLGSLVIHDRSGAAVTAAESPRLMPFIPLVTDDAATAEKKLKRFVSIYQAETDALSQTYSKEQGYKESPVLKRQASGQNPGAETPRQATPLPSTLNQQSLQRGQLYQLPNGQSGRWDGARFIVGE